jgi:K+-transporting ATPase ATPase A chain
MSVNGWIQLLFYVAVLLLLAWPLGLAMARVYEGDTPRALRWLTPLERAIVRLLGPAANREMSWKGYAGALIVFSGVGLLAVYALQRMQGFLPFNPAGLGAVTPDSSFNTATSFVTNTNWQGYGGETTMSYLSQMAALTVQNFVSAASGMAVLVALIRGFTRRNAQTVGNFWTDLTRSTVYILLPLSLILALALVSQGVVQTLSPYVQAQLVEPIAGADGQVVTTQTIAVGPAASQVAVKQLGTNGGGFFNVNSSHPFENPTPFSNLLEVLAILLIPAGLCVTFGRMVGDRRQGWALLAAMTVLFVAFLVPTALQEQAGNRLLPGAVSETGAQLEPGAGNLEGKEVRFGVAQSSLWAVATTSASNGSVNAMHDSFTPLGGLMPMVLMQLGEVVYGGVGSGLYGMIVFAIVAVFVAGLMVGRTPEYIGKKIESYEMKMASLAVLVPPMVVLLGTAVAVAVTPGKAGILNPGPHGLSEILYAFSSAGNNNGSAFAGISANTPFYNTALGLAMFFARFWVAIPVLAIAGSLAGKKIVPATAGTLPTHGPTFIVLLIAIVLTVGALTFLPALALGPIAEHLEIHGTLAH